MMFGGPESVIIFLSDAHTGLSYHFHVRGLSLNCCSNSMKRPGSPASLLFRLVVPVCAVFILTILALIASVFGDPRAPVAQWFDQHAGTLLTVEFLATMVLALLAMAIDRTRTLRSDPKIDQAEQNIPQDHSQPDSP